MGILKTKEAEGNIFDRFEQMDGKARTQKDGKEAKILRATKGMKLWRAMI